MINKDHQLLEEANAILDNGTRVEIIQHPMHADYSQGPKHPKYGRMKSTGNYPGKEDEGLKGTIIGFDNKNESGVGSRLTYTIKLENSKTRTYVSSESFKVI